MASGDLSGVSRKRRFESCRGYNLFLQRSVMLRAVTQEQPMGCGIACVACVAGISYSKALNLFSLKKASTNGFYCKDILNALKELGLNYEYKKVTAKTKKYLKREGTIIFIRRSAKYPKGHYLVKTKRGWMNPWINFPSIKPAKAGFNKKLPGKAQWVLFEK
jgi:ABC-type bacteriocin/lantibiotic exporter with double-glycine peptidase domain